MDKLPDDNYKRTIGYIASVLGKRGVNTFKKLGNNPVGLTKFEYISIILQDIEKYMITDKADGLRTILMLNPGNNSFFLNGNGKYRVSNKDLGVNISNKFILDCEYVKHHKGEYVFYVFDIISYEDQNISGKPFYERCSYLKKLFKSIEESKTIKLKKFYSLKISNYQKNIMLLWDPNTYGAGNVAYGNGVYQFIRSL